MSMNWRTTGQMFGILFAGLLIFLLSVTLIIALLVATERGTRVTLSLVERFAPGDLIIDHQHGSLLGELALNQLTFKDQRTDLEINQLVIDWSPGQLLSGTMHLKNLEFSSLALNFEPGSATEDQGPQAEIQLPDVNLPVDLQIDRITLNNLDLQIGTFSQHVQRIELVAQSRGYEQSIEHLVVRTEQGEVRANGVVKTRGDYPVNLSIESSLSLPDLQQLNVQADVEGDVKALNIDLDSDGLADAELHARVSDLLNMEELSWQAQLQIDAIRHEALYEQVRSLSVGIQTEGSIDVFNAVIEGDIDSVSHGLIYLSGDLGWQDMELVINKLEADFEDQPAFVEVEGTAAFGEELDIDIRGYADLLGFTVSDFSLRATGDEQGAHDLVLAIDIPQGQAEISGSLLWQPYLSWNLDVQLSNVNLADINQDLAGEVALVLSTDGQFNQELEVNASIEELSGSIFEQPINGRGEVRVQGDALMADNLDIQWGDARVQADGRFSPDSLDLTWLLSVPDLQNLVPGSEGRIASRGQVVGSQQQPRLQIELDVDGFRWNNYQVEESMIDVEVDGTLETLPVGDIIVRNAQFNDQVVQRIELRMRADEQHSVEADIDYGALQARLALHGIWDLQQRAWEGEVSRIQLRYPDIGRWNLSNPAQLKLSPQQAQLSDFCLAIVTRESQICADGQWTAESGDIQLAVRADDVPYQLFNPWIPDDIQLMGEFSLVADVEQIAEQLSADIRLNITDSSVRVPAQELRVDFDSGELLRIQGNQDELAMQLKILSEQLEGGIEANALLRDPLQNTRQIDGELGIDIRSFGLVSVLIPDIQNVGGQLNGRIDVNGPFDDLLVGGGIELSDGSAEIPATGLELRNLNLTIQAPSTNDSPFTLEGAVDAGDGQLSINGEYYLREQRAQLAIQGAAFPALNTRDLQVTIAPDLEIEYTPELLRLRGEVEVPRARITPPDFETVDTVSSDTMVVGGEGGPYDQSVGALPVDMDLNVRLGDDVQVSAYGFEGRLEGALRIIEQSGQETTGIGNIDVASGEYEIYGQALNIERGRLIFTGGPVANPGLDLRVERNIDAQSVTVGARVGGSLENPTLNLFSTPNMQDSAILSYLIFGRGPGQGSTGEENMLARATLALGMSGGNRLGERLSNTLGVDEITLDSGDTFDSTALYIGKQLSNRLYIKYGVGLVEPVSTFFIQYRLTDNLNFESRTGNEQSGVDLFYTIER